MFKNVHIRASIFVLLSGTVLSCLVWFGAVPIAPENGIFPDNDDVIENHEKYTGDRVVVDGTIIATDPVTIRVRADSGTTIELQITEIDRDIVEDDVLSVYGTLQPDQQITAINTVVKPSDSYWRTRIFSAIAGLWVLWRGLRHWRPNVRDVLITRREESDA